MQTESASNHDLTHQPAEPPALPGREEYQALGKPPGFWTVAEAILKHPARVVYELGQGNADAVTAIQLGIAVVCLLVYGLTVGMFSWGIQLWAAPVKITLGVLFSALICLPSLFIFSCLAGSDASGRQVVGVLAGVVCLASLLLLGFGPVSWIFSQSTDSVFFMGALHLVFWIIGTRYGLAYLYTAFQLLSGKQAAHLALWSAIFVLVTVQMTTTLRPIVGTSDRFLQTEKRFFLAHWVECAEHGEKGAHGL